MRPTKPAPGSYGNVYVNMPPFGLSKAGRVRPVVSERQSAPGWLRAGAGDDNAAS